jgi:hypothetical protein
MNLNFICAYNTNVNLMMFAVRTNKQDALSSFQQSHHSCKEIAISQKDKRIAHEKQSAKSDPIPIPALSTSNFADESKNDIMSDFDYKTKVMRRRLENASIKITEPFGECKGEDNMFDYEKDENPIEEIEFIDSTSDQEDDIFELEL